MESCVDSGCGESCHGDRLAKSLGYSPEESAQSRRGHAFTGPGGEKYLNKGKVQLNALDESGRPCKTSFSVAEGVEQVRGSVADMNDSGNLVVFGKDGSALIPGRTAEAAQIRKAMERCDAATAIHRRKNNFFIPLWVQGPEPKDKSRSATSTFPRRGA